MGTLLQISHVQCSCVRFFGACPDGICYVAICGSSLAVKVRATSEETLLYPGDGHLGPGMPGTRAMAKGRSQRDVLERVSRLD